MTKATRNPFSRNIGLGPTMTPNPRIGSLQFNIWNMQVGSLKVGTRQWWNAMLRTLNDVGFDELASVASYRGKPWFLRNHGNFYKQLSSRIGSNNTGKHKPKLVPQTTMRLERALSRAGKCNRNRMSFLTVVTSVALTKESALEHVKAEGNRLDRFIRNRFPHAIWIMFPEVDLKLAKNVSRDLIPDRSWKRGVGDNHLVYKVHFHGMIYVPSMDNRQVERSFLIGRSGKRSKVFSGTSQVRALEVNQSSVGNEADPDVMGITGYSTKCHFKPPVETRMIEGFAEWVWLTDKIMSDQSLILIGGTRGEIQEYCGRCQCHSPKGTICSCSMDSKTESDSGSTEAQSDSNDSVPDSVCDETSPSPEIGLTTILNSDDAGHCDKYEKPRAVEKNVKGFFASFWRLASLFFGFVRGP